MSGEPSRDALHNLCLADPVWAERYEGWIELGHGGSASVIRTRGKALDQDLALKIFPRLSAEDWRRFQEEVRNAQHLTSRYIVRTYSPFPRGSFAWIEQELIDGCDLKHELERRAHERTPFAVGDALQIAIAITTALVFAHDSGVIHRDVKPANVLLPRDGQPVAKLGDFGISRLSGAARLTKTGLLVGTPQFASPEVIGGSLGGTPADVYSLSLCLFLMLSGNRFPFDVADESSPTQWMRAHLDQKPKSILEFNEAMPPALASLLERGLAKDPARRPRAVEYLDVLRSAAAALTTGKTRVLPARRSGVFLPALVVAALVIVVAAVRLRPASPAAEPVASPAAASTTLAAAPPPSPEAAEPKASPTEPAAAPEAPLLRASFRGEMVAIANAGATPLSDVRITLISRSGERYVARAPTGVAPGEELYLALDEFTPIPSAGVRPAALEIVAAEGTARRAVRIPFK
jgi:hypothetical protein